MTAQGCARDYTWVGRSSVRRNVIVAIQLSVQKGGSFQAGGVVDGIWSIAMGMVVDIWFGGRTEQIRWIWGAAQERLPSTGRSTQ